MSFKSPGSAVNCEPIRVCPRFGFDNKLFEKRLFPTKGG